MSNGLQVVLHDRFEFFHDEHLVHGLHELGATFPGQGPGKTHFQHAHLVRNAQIIDGIHHVIEAHAVGHNAPLAVTDDLVEGRLFRLREELIIFLEQFLVEVSRDRRNAHEVKRILLEMGMGDPRFHGPQLHPSPDVGKSCGGSDDDGKPRLLGEVKGGHGPVLHLLGVAGFEHGQTREPRIVAVVLLVLARKKRRIIGIDDHHPSFDAGVCKGHQRIRRHIETHVFHGDHGPEPAHRGPGPHFHGYFLVGGVLEVQIGFLTDIEELFGDLRGGGPRIACGERDACLQSPPGNRLVAQQEHLLSRCIFK